MEGALHKSKWHYYRNTLSKGPCLIITVTGTAKEEIIVHRFDGRFLRFLRSALVEKTGKIWSSQTGTVLWGVVPDIGNLLLHFTPNISFSPKHHVPCS